MQDTSTAQQGEQGRRLPKDNWNPSVDPGAPMVGSLVQERPAERKYMLYSLMEVSVGAIL